MSSSTKKEITKPEKLEESVGVLEKGSETVNNSTEIISKKKRRKRGKVAVVNANGDEGASIVRTLARKGKFCLSVIEFF